MPGAEKQSRRPMPKFLLIGKKKLPKGAGLSRPKISLENQRLKFYRAKGNNFFAVAIGNPGDNERMLKVSIQKLDNATLRFEPFAAMGIFVFPRYLFLADAKVWPNGRPMPVKGQKSGFNVFRLFLNEAIAVARNRGLEEIVLKVNNARIQSYYESLGFTFDEKRYGKFFLK